MEFCTSINRNDKSPCLLPVTQVRLAVAGAFHTRFMDPAVSRLEAKLAATQIRTPRIPVISNVDAQPHSDPEVIKKILARQVSQFELSFLHRLSLNHKEY